MTMPCSSHERHWSLVSGLSVLLVPQLGTIFPIDIRTTSSTPAFKKKTQDFSISYILWHFSTPCFYIFYILSFFIFKGLISCCCKPLLSIQALSFEPGLHSLWGSWRVFRLGPISPRNLNGSGWNLELSEGSRCALTQKIRFHLTMLERVFCHNNNNTQLLTRRMSAVSGRIAGVNTTRTFGHLSCTDFETKTWIGVRMRALVKNFRISTEGISQTSKTVKNRYFRHGCLW